MRTVRRAARGTVKAIPYRVIPRKGSLSRVTSRAGKVTGKAGSRVTHRAMDKDKDTPHSELECDSDHGLSAGTTSRAALRTLRMAVRGSAGEQPRKPARSAADGSWSGRYPYDGQEYGDRGDDYGGQG
jgi:hypothetical protein